MYTYTAYTPKKTASPKVMEAVKHEFVGLQRQALPPKGSVTCVPVEIVPSCSERLLSHEREAVLGPRTFLYFSIPTPTVIRAAAN